MLPLLRRAGDASLWSCVATRVRADMEFMAAPSDHNVQDHIAWLGAWADQTHEAQHSLRMLRHYASSVKHQQYHDIDIVSIHVKAGRSSKRQA